MTTIELNNLSVIKVEQTPKILDALMFTSVSNFIKLT